MSLPALRCSDLESNESFIAGLPLVDLHNDRSFYLSARGIPFSDCERASICDREYDLRKRFFFAIWRPPFEVRAGAPWYMSEERAEALNNTSNFDYLKQAIGDLRATGIEISDDPARLSENHPRLAFIGIEGAHLLHSDSGRELSAQQMEARVVEARSLGVSYLGPTWSMENRYMGVAGKGVGLKPAGKDLLNAMIRQGLLIDLSHASDQTVRDVYALTGGDYPLFFSHSSVRALCAHERNLDDSLLELMRRSDGVTGINFHAPYVDCSGEATTEDVIEHFIYLKETIGVRHIAFGSDLDGFIRIPGGLERPADMRDIGLRLMERGFTREEIEMIFYRNASRVLTRAQNYPSQ